MRQWAADAFEGRDAASGFGGEELQQTIAFLQKMHAFAGGSGARQPRQFVVACGGEQARAAAGRNGEACTGFPGGIELRRRQHRADADHRAFHFGGDGADGVQGSGGAQGDFDGGNTARDQGAGQPDRVRDLIDDDNRNDGGESGNVLQRGELLIVGHGRILRKCWRQGRRCRRVAGTRRTVHDRGRHARRSDLVWRARDWPIPAR
ncbi:MAG: hypothetical protein BWZ07_00716 [Alphaproteobacteria bacterium ADurb.BinA280]|nr:MAG: hypothetical protein BWZ07_00716 [Alphaproteobacteria bacterium ADurb.BinA280]